MRQLFWAATAAVLMLQGCADNTAPAAVVDERRPVAAVTAVAESYAAPVIAIGRLSGENESVLSFKIGGLVSRVAVEAGQRVRRGQLLASLNTAEISAEVSRAEAALAKAERDQARVVQLFAGNVVTAAERDDAATAVELARAGVQIAKFNAKHARITAPSEGLVLSRLAEQNEMVAPGQPILQIQGGSSDWEVRVGLPERDAVRVRLGDNAVVKLSAYDGAKLAATVAELAPTAQPGTGTFSAKLALAPTALRLMSGLSARVEIAPFAQETLVFVPLGALVEADGERGSVFVIKMDGTVQRQEVVIGLVRGEQVGLKRGIAAGERVVSVGASYLSSGETVRLARAELVR